VFPLERLCLLALSPTTKQAVRGAFNLNEGRRRRCTKSSPQQGLEYANSRGSTNLHTHRLDPHWNPGEADSQVYLRLRLLLWEADEERRGFQNGKEKQRR